MIFLKKEETMKEMQIQDWKKHWDRANSSALTRFIDFFFWRLPVYQILKKLLKNIPQNPRILDLGAGDGQDSCWLLKKFGGTALLVDNYAEILEKARHYAAKENLFDRITTITCDVFNLSFSEEFDLVYSNGLLEHFYNSHREELLDIHLRAVKKGGYVFLIVPADSWIYWKNRKFLEKTGAWIYKETPLTKNELEKYAEKHHLKLTIKTFWFSGLMAVLFEK